MGFFDYFKAILAIVAIIFASLYLTRLIAKTSGGKIGKNTGMKLIGSIPLARDRSVAVVEIGSYAYVIGVGGQHVERLDKLPASEFQIHDDEPIQKNFSDCFKAELSAHFKKPVDR